MTDVKTLASGGAIPVALLMSSSAVFVEVALSCLELYIICRSVFTIPGLPVDKKREVSKKTGPDRRVSLSRVVPVIKSYYYIIIIKLSKVLA
ncbi:hypothetical protein ACROYT_G033573 [Oculina patagonica]